ncbi:MAG: rod shape-determining protein MreD [Lachnospiraceae bacterium]|nr:rod shape-determining protein MreD [Lachnospiraceae bacterium]
MKKSIVYILFIFILFLLQTTFFGWINVAGIVPNCLLAFSISAALVNGSSEGMIAGFAGGLLLDILYSNIIGMYAFAFVVITFVMGKFHEMFYREDITIPTLIIGVGDLIYGIYMFAVAFVTRHETNLFFFLRRIILPEMIYTMLVGIIIYKLTSLAFGRVDRKGSDDLIV